MKDNTKRLRPVNRFAAQLAEFAARREAYAARHARPLASAAPLVKCPHCGAWTAFSPCHNRATPIPPVVKGGQGRGDAEIEAGAWVFAVIGAACGCVGTALIFYVLCVR